VPFRSRTPIRSRDPRLEEEIRTASSIVRRIRAGDADAEAEMVERYSKGLRYLLAQRVHDDERARDLLQDTFCIAIEKLRNTDIENPERLAGYLRGIAIRVALNAGRRQARLSYGLDIEALERIPDSEPRQFQNLAAEQTTAAVRKLLDSVPVERDRELLLRFYVYDQDKQEICLALGLDSLHFNRVLFRAKGRFRKILEEAGDMAEPAPI
jgi:RNA polymerase sigma-70 factor (ECF subfamily)